MSEIHYASLLRKKRIRRNLISVFFISSVIFIFFAWKENISKTHSPNKSNTLSISGPWEISSLDPSKQGYILTRMQVIETLLHLDKKGLITAGLATHWTNSEDALNWHFILRQGVSFHDGTKMNAASVVQSLSHALNKHGVLKKAGVTQITALNPHEIKIELEKPYAALPSLLTHYSNVILSPGAYDAKGEVKKLLGTGAYQIESVSLPHKIQVEKFDDYWGEKPKIAFASYLTGHRAESRILQAQSGDTDIVFSLDPAMLSQLENNPLVSVHSYKIPRTLYIKVNAAHRFLNETKVRKALSLGSERDTIASHVLKTEGAQTAQIMPTSMSQWFIQGLDNNQYDAKKAQTLLKDAGWTRGKSGLLERNGEPFTLTLITYADRPELTSVATAIQAQWAKLGIRLNVNVTNSSSIPAAHQDNSLELALIARHFGLSADPLSIIRDDFTHGGGDWGAMNWHNTKVDNAVSALMQSKNTSDSFQLAQEVAKEIYQDVPVIPIATYSQHISVNKRVKHFAFDPFERDYFINQMEIK